MTRSGPCMVTCTLDFRVTMGMWQLVAKWHVCPEGQEESSVHCWLQVSLASFLYMMLMGEKSA
jgi:hypothetical protein